MPSSGLVVDTRKRVLTPSQWAEDAWNGKEVVQDRFKLSKASEASIRAVHIKFGFGVFGEIVYHRTYSRIKADGSNESWHDTVIRVVNGVMSIRKDWYRKSGLEWQQGKWQKYACRMAVSMVQMHWLPPGRGLFAMGADLTYKRGAGALYNCSYGNMSSLSDDSAWLMEALMCGVGVGFEAKPENTEMCEPSGEALTYSVPDTKEGWAESVRVLIESYESGSNPIEFTYERIRAAGSPLKTFGGVASGPGPLIQLHDRIRVACSRYVAKEISSSRLKADVCNSIGCAVVMGNIRRSAQIMLGDPTDDEFYRLKDWSVNPDREDIGWMSNNSLALTQSKHFDEIPRIADGIRLNGEPGFVNFKNVQKFGRFGRPMADKAVGVNPCSEIFLEDREVCNLSETFPTRCQTSEDFFEALGFATFYSSTVSLLPTQWASTNRVVVRNRRIGVSISGIADWAAKIPFAKLTRTLRRGYEHVREQNAYLAAEAGVTPSIRVTCVKPSGTISLLAGVSPGMHFPPERVCVRRMRVGENMPIAELLMKAGVPYERDSYSDGTWCFEFPIHHGATRAAPEVSMWEQFSILAMLQREWADNGVSATVNFNPDTEGSQVENVLSQFAPVLKAVSMLPSKKNIYKQAPYEAISDSEYSARLAAIKPINWNKMEGSDGVDEKYCANDSCTI